MKTTRTEAIVLRRTDYGEADRIVQFLTPGSKIAVLARGVRREKSKLAGGIELLAVCDITVHEGKGQLLTLTSARSSQFFGKILHDFNRLNFAYFVLRDIAKAAEQIDEPEFFTITKRTLAALDDSAIPLGVIELCYRLQMAALLGVGVNLTRDRDGKKLRVDVRYSFSVGDMAFFEKEQGEFSADSIKILRLASVAAPKVVASVQRVEQFLPSVLTVARAGHE